MFAYMLNFICTGRCRVEEEEDEVAPVNNGGAGGTGGRAENGQMRDNTGGTNRYL